MTGLGIIGTYFSEPFVSSYTAGSAIHVVISQAKEALGLRNTRRFHGAFKIPKMIYDMSINITTINFATFITSIICIFYLIIFREFLGPKLKKKIKFEFPSELLLVNIFIFS